MVETKKKWRYKPLGELAKVQSGGTPSRGNKDYWDGQIPWVKISDISGLYVSNTEEKISELGLLNSSATLFPKGTILFTIFATIGKVGVLSIDATTNQAIAGITPNDEIDPKFLTYALIELAFSVGNKGKGVAQKNINLTILKSTEIPLPSMNDQKRIVQKLDKLFAHLEKIKERLDQIPELLKQFRQAVLTQAVTGKLTEEWRKGRKLKNIDDKEVKESRSKEIDYENKKLLKSGKRAQKVTPFLSKGINKIGWLLVNVESACIFIVDCLHNTPKFDQEGKFVVDTTCITPFKIDFNKARKVSDVNFEKWVERLQPSAGDILFSREGTIGIGVKVPANTDLCIGQRMMLFRLLSHVKPEFAEIYFNSYPFRDEYIPHVKGVAAQHLNIGSIRNLDFPIPTFAEQTEIVRRVEALFSNADEIEQRYKELKQQIDKLQPALLAKAFRGELG